MSGSVLIAAFNEEQTIGSLLAGLLRLVNDSDAEIIVVANGCTDRTEDVVRAFDGVRLLTTPVPSKSAALNMAMESATRWPRLILDADVEMSSQDVLRLWHYIAAEGLLAARPKARWVLDGQTPTVRAFYRARIRADLGAGHLWGAGAYALSAEGGERVGQFPLHAPDDLYVDAQFRRHEKGVAEGSVSVVHLPTNLGGLLSILRRARLTNRLVRSVDGDGQKGSSSLSSLKAVVQAATGPSEVLDAAVYAAVSVYARVASATQARDVAVWHRDESSRRR